ncbi:DUF2251 domain-containing protein [Comamonadaceae bacterium G21597-S1]|nr:DUF2251 domain-containing protein [Comamonadaceae bacterium G21597-S1]
MRIQVTAAGTLHVGQPLVLQGDSPDERFSAVFEDDGETGYFYARERAGPIRDALHIYNARGVEDRDAACVIKAGWSEDGKAVVLLINDLAHAVFDFHAQRGWCRSGYPLHSAGGAWSAQGHEWEEAALALFA